MLNPFEILLWKTSMLSYMMHAIPDKLLLHKAAWPCASSKVQQSLTKVNVKHIWHFDVENIPVKLQN